MSRGAMILAAASLAMSHAGAAELLTPRGTHSMAQFNTVLFEIPLDKDVKRWCRSNNKQYAADLESGRRQPDDKLDYCSSWDAAGEVCYVTFRHGLSRRQQEKILGDAVVHCALNADHEIRRGG